MTATTPDAFNARLTLSLPDDLAVARGRDARGLGGERQVRAASGGATHALDRRGRGRVARLARRSPTTQLAQLEQLERIARRRARGRLHARAPARHGRLEPRSRGARAYLRHARRVARSCTCSTRPIRPGARRRGARRPRAHAVHRVEQVRHDARAEHLQAVLLRARGRGGRRRGGGKPLHRDHRPGLEARGGRAAATASAHVAHGVEVDRRPLLGAVGLRHGAGRGRRASTCTRCSSARSGWRTRARPCVPAARQPGRRARRGDRRRARRGRDKLTLVASPAIHDLGAWLEQLLAESTGKQGKGVIPVDREPLGAPDGYGEDRLFVYLRLGSRRRRAGRARSRRSSGPGTRWCGSTLRRPVATSAASSSAGSSRPRSPAR